MGVYIYSARATGRIPAWVDGGYHYIFPLKFEFKPHMFESNDRWWAKADAQARRIEKRDDWTGYVSFAGCVYHVMSPVVDDGNLGSYKGEIYSGPEGAVVR